jgi:hypothetical protein
MKSASYPKLISERYPNMDYRVIHSDGRIVSLHAEGTNYLFRITQEQFEKNYQLAPPLIRMDHVIEALTADLEKSIDQRKALCDFILLNWFTGYLIDQDHAIIAFLERAFEAKKIKNLV